MKVPLHPFFVVWRPNGGPPVKRHGNRFDAEKEAERIARLMPGSEVFVMAPVTRLTVQAVDRTEFIAPHPTDCICSQCDEAPF